MEHTRTLGLLLLMVGCHGAIDEDLAQRAEVGDLHLGAPGEAQRPGAETPLSFTTVEIGLIGDRATGWRFGPEGRVLGGLMEAGPQLAPTTLSLATPTGEWAASISTQPSWEGELIDSRRLWLGGEAVDWVVWRDDTGVSLELRGAVSLSLDATSGTRDVDGWVAEDHLLLAACGDEGLEVFTIGFAGSLLAWDRVDTPGDRCSVLAAGDEPIVLHGDEAGGPLVRHRLRNGELVDGLQLHPDTRADRVVTATAADQGMLALFNGEQVLLMDTHARTQLVAETRFAEPLVLDILPDGTTAVAWADEEGRVHAYWGTQGEPFFSRTFAIHAPPAGLATALSQEALSVAVFHGSGVVLARQAR